MRRLTYHGAHSASRQAGGDSGQAHPPGAGPRDRPLPARLVENDDDDGDDEEEKRLSRVESFSKWLAGVIPVNLIPSDLAAMLRHRANHRFAMAREQGVPMEQIYFGQDCLPTWETQYWDPEEESLHSILQERLCDLDRALQLSTLLQREIQNKSNARMELACELGIHLDAIAMGSSLLPEWDTSPESAESSGTQTSTVTTDLTSGSHDDEEADSSMTGSKLAEGETPEMSFVDDGDGSGVEVLDAEMDDAVDLIGYASSEDSGMLGAQAEDAVDLSKHAVLETAHVREPVLKRKWCSESSDSSSDEEDESSDGEDDDAVDIYLNNHVSPQPVYDEHGRSNILHDVEVVGVPGEPSSVVDLEVYLAVDDDDDEEDLAEVELAVDRAAYERCFGVEGAIDVHIPGAEIFCFNRVEELGEEEVDEDENEDGVDEGVDDQDVDIELNSSDSEGRCEENEDGEENEDDVDEGVDDEDVDIELSSSLCSEEYSNEHRDYEGVADEDVDVELDSSLCSEEHGEENEDEEENAYGIDEGIEDDDVDVELSSSRSGEFSEENEDEEENAYGIDEGIEDDDVDVEPNSSDSEEHCQENEDEDVDIELSSSRSGEFSEENEDEEENAYGIDDGIEDDDIDVELNPSHSEEHCQENEDEDVDIELSSSHSEEFSEENEDEEENAYSIDEGIEDIDINIELNLSHSEEHCQENEDKDVDIELSSSHSEEFSEEE
ncbi:hypothetical protein E4U54_001014 [Claviceps lovelessii]|nr:hypothetical protein E4U54_001014 [Claviceps lovelessii]